MKKQLYFIIILLLVSLVGCRSAGVISNAVVTINGKVITNEQVEDRLQYLKVLERIYQTWLPQVYNDGIPDSVREATTLDTDRASVLQQMIRYEVINQYRAANGRLYEEDDARQEAERNFRDLKKDKLYERALQEALAYYRISEKDFLVLSYSVSYDALNYWAEESLYKTENRQADADDNALSHEFDLFVDQLVEQAEIKYF